MIDKAGEMTGKAGEMIEKGKETEISDRMFHAE